MTSNQEENNTFTSRAIFAQQVRPKVLDLILKTGIVKKEKTAVRILLLGTMFIFASAIFILVSSTTQKELPRPVTLPAMVNTNSR